MSKDKFSIPNLHGLLGGKYNSSDETLDNLQTLIDLIETEPRTDQLPELLLEHLIRIFDPDIACYYVKELGTQNYRRAASFPTSYWEKEINQKKFDKRPSKGGSIGQAINKKEIVFVYEEDPLRAESEGGYFPFDSSVKSEIVVPILAPESFTSQDHVEALIIISRGEGKTFAPWEKQLIRIVGFLINTAYKNSLAKELRERRITFLRRLTELQTDDFDELFRNFLKALSELVPSKLITLWLYNDLDETLVIRSFYPTKIGSKKIGFDSFDKRILNCSESLSGNAILLRSPKLYTTINERKAFSNPKFARDHDLSWFICFPILNLEKNPLGVVNLWPIGRPQDFGEESLSALQTYISPVANTIRLATLMSEESLLQAYDAFFDNLLRFDNQRKSWDNLADLVREQMKCEGCSIFFVESDGFLRLRGSTGIIGNPPYQSVVYKPGEGFTGKALEDNEPISLYQEMTARGGKSHKPKFSETVKKPFQCESTIFVQILDQENKPGGVIRCSNKEESPSRHVGRFTKEDVTHLQNIAKVISNVHSKVVWLREREQERERSLNSLHHEILSPIDGILAHIEWMERHFQRIEPSSKLDVDRIWLKFNDMKQSSKLIDMIVTTMGRIDDVRLRIEEFSVVEAIKTCVSFLTNESRRKKIEIEIDYLGLPRVRGDQFQLMRVFYNLLRNAIKYSDPGEPEKYIRISATEDHAYYLLSFTDNGIGIAKGEENSIFKMFVRGVNAAKFFPEGSGLGLSYCKSIMEKHGGYIVIDPKHLSKPTIFQVCLPKKVGDFQ